MTSLGSLTNAYCNNIRRESGAEDLRITIEIPRAYWGWALQDFVQMILRTTTIRSDEGLESVEEFTQRTHGGYEVTFKRMDR